jgi:hypothetical protein
MFVEEVEDTAVVVVHIIKELAHHHKGPPACVEESPASSI